MIEWTLEELLEGIEEQAERGVGGWTLPPGQNVLVQAPGGHLTAVHTSLLKDWAASLRRHLAPSRGDLINARARAGAVLVEEEAALARIPRAATLIREAHERRVAAARAAYAKAKAAEAAAS